MDVVIDTRGFKLAEADRERLQRCASELDDVVRVELELDARSTTLFSSDSHFRIKARVTTTAGEVVERGTVVPALSDASELFRDLDTQLWHKRLVDNGVERSCAWCDSGTFVLARLPAGKLAAHVLICTGCGHAEHFIRDRERVRAIDGAVVVHARAKLPYR
jgi:hypothetical protein